MKQVYIDLLNRLIDDLIDCNGVEWTIEYFKDIGLTREDILDLGFDEDDIDKVFKEDYND